MKIFYFTSTGNSLAVAKRILASSPDGGELISIPKAWDLGTSIFEDDVIGFVFPVFSFGIPALVKKFFEEMTWMADYTFTVLTYGNRPGSAASTTQNLADDQGKVIDYVATLLMVDNYLPFYFMEDEIASLPKKRIEENLAQIIKEISEKKRVHIAVNPQLQAASIYFKAREKLAHASQEKLYILGDNCTKCGICAKVCPSGNIEVTENGPVFDGKCLYCLGCLHNCPVAALHHSKEKSAMRWRNPEVTLEEIISSNCQI